MADESPGVEITYLPLETMDRLHVLLLRCVASEPRKIEAISDALALPIKVVKREVELIEHFGLVQMMHDTVQLSGRGMQIAFVAKLFQWNSRFRVDAIAEQWRVGSGVFATSAMLRNVGSIRRRAKQLSIDKKKDAIEFLRQRVLSERTHAKFLESFITQSTDDLEPVTKRWCTIEQQMQFADTKEAVAELEKLFEDESARLYKENLVTQSETDEMSEAFKSTRLSKYHANRELKQIQDICEALLISKWVKKQIEALADAFKSEPASFRFHSDVPLPSADRKPISETEKRSSPKPAPPEGIIRSFFRWLTG